MESIDDKSKLVVFVKHNKHLNMKQILMKNYILLIKNALRKVLKFPFKISIDIPGHWHLHLAALQSQQLHRDWADPRNHKWVRIQQPDFPDQDNPFRQHS